MKKLNLKEYLKFILLFSLALLFVISCKNDKKAKEIVEIEPEAESVIEIVTNAMEFNVIDTIPSGWNTFRYKNNSDETHFFLLEKYPEGKSIHNSKNEVFPVFDKGMDLINSGKVEEGYAAFNDLPAWFFDVKILGGSGLISPKHTSETTLKLESGNYLIECYVKMPNGKFHASMGMVKEIFVKEEDSGNYPSDPIINLSISSTEGMSYAGNIKKGEQIFSVEFIDQIKHENFMGHDVNLVKLDDNANLEDLESWMNWSDPKGLISPAPQGVTFLGGVNDCPAGSVGYFKVNLDAGKYALISEVPSALKKGMLKTFTISD
jgi:uncharacterized cupredoxin-like copper-binding protein